MSVKKPKGDKNTGMSEKWISGTGQELRIHKNTFCIGEHCPIHNPSKHHMRKWKLNWRQDRMMMERMCEHGIGHPDPDDVAFRAKRHNDYDTMHGCDGCCVKKGGSNG